MIQTTLAVVKNLLIIGIIKIYTHYGGMAWHGMAWHGMTQTIYHPTTVSFHGQEIPIIEKDGIPYVAMKPICEGMGLDWEAQRQLIERDLVLQTTTCIIKVVAKDGKQREMLSLPLLYLNGWLFKINAGRYKKDDPRREVIIIYQKECFVALYDYWHKGAAINPRAVPKEHSELIGLRNMTIKFLAEETENAFRLAEKYGITGNQAKLAVNEIIRFRYNIDCLALLGVSHLVGSDACEEYLTPTEIGRKIGCSAKEVNKRLTKAGFQKSFRDKRNRLCYEPTEKGMLFAIFENTSIRKKLLWKKSVILMIS